MKTLILWARPWYTQKYILFYSAHFLNLKIRHSLHIILKLNPNFIKYFERTECFISLNSLFYFMEFMIEFIGENCNNKRSLENKDSKRKKCILWGIYFSLKHILYFQRYFWETKMKKTLFNLQLNRYVINMNAELKFLHKKRYVF